MLTTFYLARVPAYAILVKGTIYNESTIIILSQKQPKDHFLKFLNASAFYVPARYMAPPLFVMVSTTALMQEVGMKRSSVTVIKV